LPSTAAPNTGWVELSNQANGYVVADGVMFERI
jgi:hypothetical protein